jgi:hypothetical protein
MPLAIDTRVRRAVSGMVSIDLGDGEPLPCRSPALCQPSTGRRPGLEVDLVEALKPVDLVIPRNRREEALLKHRWDISYGVVKLGAVLRYRYL